MTTRWHSLLLYLLATCAALPASSVARCESPTVSIPAGTPLAVKIGAPLPMKVGEPIRAEMIYPVYVDNRLVLPAGTVVRGSVVSLRPNRARRIRALLGGDFTPFHTPVVRFDHILLADGTSVALEAEPASEGAPIYRVVAPPAAKGGFLHREFDMGLTVARADLAVFTAPGKADRIRQFVYNEIPYHPQRIEKGTAWTIETSGAMEVSPQPPPAPVAAPLHPVRHPHFWQVQPPATKPEGASAGSWMIRAYLDTPISSETTKKGQPISASVVEPVLNPDGSVAVPQGAILVGAVTQARHSRLFGRTGILSFNFNSLTLPGEKPQNVAATLTGADSNGAALALNSEGQVKSRPQDKIAIPVLLTAMASWPLHETHQGGDQYGKNGAGGAAGLGLLGTVAGLAGSSPYAAAGIGYWGAAVAIYYRWIAHGTKIAFAKDTRIVVQTTPRHSAPIRPNPQP